MARAGGEALAASGDGDFAQAHRELLADPAIQFDLTALTPPEPPFWQEWVEAALRWVGARLAPYSEEIFWGLLIAGAAVVLLIVLRELWGVRWRLPGRRRPTETDEPDWRPAAATASSLLAEADALAARGDYAGAAHLLLQRSLEDIAERRPRFLKPSLTARDIAAAESLPAPARGAFAEIAARVETSLFGRTALDRGGWEACRRAYARLAFPESWR